MTTSSDRQRRILELNEQARQARAMASGEDERMAMAARYGLPLPDRKELVQEAESAERKAQTLRDYERFEQQITRAEKAPKKTVNQAELQKAKTILETNRPAIDAITSKELSPFVKIDKKTNAFTIDVAGAVKTGVDADILKAAGISGAKQQMVRIQIRKEKEARQERGEAVKAEEKRIQAGSVLQHEPLMLELSERERNYETFERQNTRLGDGSYISNKDFESLTPYEKGLAKGSGGFTALEKYWQRKAIPKMSLPVDAKQLYEKSGPEDKFSILQSYGKVPANAVYTGSKNGEPTYRIGKGVESFVMSPEFRNVIVESVVPLVRTIGKWDEMNAGDRAWSIACDALFFLPFIGAASRGSKAAVTVSRTGRLAGAMRGMGDELMLQAKAPIDVILHPVGTVKGTARQAWDMLENIIHYKKIPQAVLTTTEGTVRIPIKGNLTSAQAMAIRNRLMTAIAGTGGDVVMEFNGMKFTLSRSALMKELGGGLAHSTPQGDAFMDGLKVTWKSGKPMTEQGVFLSHEPLTRFVKQSAFGTTGNQPSIFIVSPETARDAINTSKIYKSKFGKVAELEKKFPVDYTLPKPSQVLFTRVGPERVKTLLLLEKPLSKTQVAKLKSLAIIEDLKAPFKPSLLIEKTDDYIKGSSKFSQTLDIREYNSLIRELERSGNRVIARNLRAVWTGLDNARQVRRTAAERERVSRIPAAAKRIGVGNIRVGSRVGRDVPRNALFTIHAERIGRVTQKPESVSRPGSVRITNTPDRPYTTTKVRKKDDYDTPVPPKPRKKDKDDTPVPPKARKGDDDDTPVPPKPRKKDKDDTPVPPKARKGDDDDTPVPPKPRKKDKDDTPVPPRPRIGDDDDTPVPPRPRKGDKEKKGKRSSDQDIEWTSETLKSAIAWKDGFVVHAIKYPYRRGVDEKTFHVDNVPPGLAVLDIHGKGSEGKSIKVPVGRLTQTLTVDVGNQDKIIKPISGGRRAKIRSVRDTRNTTSQMTVKRKNLSKKRGKVFHTKANGGTIISRRPLYGY